MPRPRQVSCPPFPLLWIAGLMVMRTYADLVLIDKQVSRIAWLPLARLRRAPWRCGVAVHAGKA